MIARHDVLRLIRDFLIEKDYLKSHNSSLEDLATFFEYLVISKYKFNSAYLLNYLWKNISAQEVAKRKTSARDFEDYLSILFSGTISDEIKRANKNKFNQNIFVENEFITNFVLSNRREKLI